MYLTRNFRTEKRCGWRPQRSPRRWRAYGATMEPSTWQKLATRWSSEPEIWASREASRDAVQDTSRVGFRCFRDDLEMALRRLEKPARDLERLASHGSLERGASRDGSRASQDGGMPLESRGSAHVRAPSRDGRVLAASREARRSIFYFVLRCYRPILRWGLSGWCEVISRCTPGPRDD